MKNISTAFLLLTLTACASTSLRPEATLIRLTHVEPSADKCQFLGDITGNQGDFLTGAFTSNENLETGARHDLKNKAHALGGNVVYILTQRAGQSGGINEYGGDFQQTNVTLSGNVYKCPN